MYKFLYILGLALVVVLAYGIYVWDQNIDTDRKQSYFLERSSLCRQLGQKQSATEEQEQHISLSGARLIYTQFRYNEEEDLCVFEVEEQLQADTDDGKQTWYRYAMIDLFLDVDLGGFSFTDRDDIEEIQFQCSVYHKLRQKHFGDDLPLCVD